MGSNKKFKKYIGALFVAALLAYPLGIFFNWLIVPSKLTCIKGVGLLIGFCGDPVIAVFGLQYSLLLVYSMMQSMSGRKASKYDYLFLVVLLGWGVYILPNMSASASFLSQAIAVIMGLVIGKTTTLSKVKK